MSYTGKITFSNHELTDPGQYDQTYYDVSRKK